MDAGEIANLFVVLGAALCFFWKLSRMSREMAGRGEPRELTNKTLQVESIDPPVTEAHCRERHQVTAEEIARITRRLEWGEKRFAKLERGFSSAVSKILEAGGDRERRLSDRIGDVVGRVRDLEGYVRGKFEKNGNGDPDHE
ncbi:MAG: hypothetical protein IT577_23795 [Verrucomicrobiae bacterium]|nr:hypothetical protein [Verrucomicrobiae bacterium]